MMKLKKNITSKQYSIPKTIMLTQIELRNNIPVVMLQ